MQVRDQEGNVVTQEVTNQAGEFTITVPSEGTYSVSAVRRPTRVNMWWSGSAPSPWIH